LFFAGFEGWSDYRRTGYPQLVAGPANVNDNRIPSRIPYPLQEQTLNANNYKEAILKMGTDDMNTRLWWQP
jgi:Susd and RagB outer membrane lipoprotein